jgi:hypothetical protein
LRVFFIHILLWVSNEGSDGLDAGAGLQILRLNLKIEKAGHFFVVGDLDGLQDADEHLLESLKVPVLVDAGVDDARVEDLLGLVGEEVAQVVHVVQLFVVLHVLLDEMRQ